MALTPTRTTTTLKPYKIILTLPSAGLSMSEFFMALNDRLEEFGITIDENMEWANWYRISSFSHFATAWRLGNGNWAVQMDISPYHPEWVTVLTLSELYCHGE